MTEEKRQAIIDAYIELGTYKKVRERLGGSSTTIWKVINDAGLSKGKGGNQKRKISDDLLIEELKTLSAMEISEKYNIHNTNVYKAMKRLGLHDQHCKDRLIGLRQNWGTKTENLKNQYAGLGNVWHFVESQNEMVNKCQPGFIYLETRKKRIRLKCKACGKTVERARASIVGKNVKCEYCKEKQKEQEALQDERLKLIRILAIIQESKTPKHCIRCGKEFYSQYPQAKYCSKKCREKTKRKGNSIRSRCRKYGVFYDPQVKSIEIFKRDHYICQICGLVCNTEDDTWGTHGAYSPTVDHIIPLAKGGTHTWDNVQCAHAICNSYKRDLITG